MFATASSLRPARAGLRARSQRWNNEVSAASPIGLRGGVQLEIRNTVFIEEIEALFWNAARAFTADRPNRSEDRLDTASKSWLVVVCSRVLAATRVVLAFLSIAFARLLVHWQPRVGGQV